MCNSIGFEEWGYTPPPTERSNASARDGDIVLPVLYDLLGVCVHDTCAANGLFFFVDSQLKY